MSLNRDYLDILARRTRGELMVVLADAFLESHLKNGTTLQDIADKLGEDVQTVRRIFDLSDKSIKKDLGDLSDLVAGLGYTMQFSLIDIKNDEIAE